MEGHFLHMVSKPRVQSCSPCWQKRRRRLAGPVAHSLQVSIELVLLPPIGLYCCLLVPEKRPLAALHATSCFVPLWAGFVPLCAVLLLWANCVALLQRRSWQHRGLPSSVHCAAVKD